MMRTAVVLPEPLGPSSPRTVAPGDLEVDAGQRRGGAEPFDQALDLDRGPGTLTAPLAVAAGPEGRTLGVDVAPGMQTLARAAAPPWARLARMDMQRLALTGGAFDTVAAAHALAFCADLPAALAE